MALGEQLNELMLHAKAVQERDGVTIEVTLRSDHIAIRVSRQRQSGRLTLWGEFLFSDLAGAAAAKQRIDVMVETLLQD